MPRPLSKRRLLAAVVPGVLAGCLVESGEDAPGSDDGSDPSAESAESANAGADGSASEAEESGSQQTDDEEVPDSVGPDGAGLLVTNAAVLDVTDGDSRTTVDARLTVENAGRFAYGTIEFRADAYAARPNSLERDAVGYATVRRRFRSAEPFDDGTRQFDVSITFRSRESRARADPDWYEVDAAVRRAEPL